MIAPLAALSLLVLAGTPADEARSSLRTLERKYGIDIQWEFEFKEIREGWTVSTRVPTEEDLIAFAPKLREAMAVYPDRLWKSGKVKTIVLAKKCLRNGVSWGGFAVHTRKALLLDVSASADPDWLRNAFHHEVYHLVDPVEDDDWNALNVEKFAYRPVHAPGAVDDRNTQPGFVSPYARTDAREDRAELFAYMVARPETVEELVKRDDILRRKVRRMKRATAVYGLDAAWWRKRGL